MKTIVYVNGKKHSAWDDIKQAKNQMKVLLNYGYKKVRFECIDHNYSNGYYFV